jgi:hypothetical protein
MSHTREKVLYPNENVKDLCLECGDMEMKDDEEDENSPEKIDERLRMLREQEKALQMALAQIHSSINTCEQKNSEVDEFMIEE